MVEVSITTSSIMHNYPLVSAIVAFALAQAIKFFTTWFVRFVFPFFLSYFTNPVSNTIV